MDYEGINIISDFKTNAVSVGAVGTFIWLEIAENAAAQLAKYYSALLSAPGKRFINDLYVYPLE